MASNHINSINQGNGPLPQRIKLVCVGDGGCGKTALLTVFNTGRFPETWLPTVFETTQTLLTVDGRQVDLSLWDTAGQEEYGRLLPLSLNGADIILICFDITMPDSYANVAERWGPEIGYSCPGSPIILVGLKTDLRFDQNIIQSLAKSQQRPLTYEDGMQMANRIGAKAYMECSARHNLNIRPIFETSVRVATGGGARRNGSRNTASSE
ncbi:hypothetical protein HDU76_003586, partial [Blyttiomyces sp. JEL0837]